MIISEKLVTSNNLIRYIIRKMDEDFNNKCCMDHDFWKHVIDEGLKTGVIHERSPGVYELTSDEHYVRKPRHRGKIMY